MKSFKTVISVILAVTLIACVFGACKETKKKEDNTETQIVTVTDENGEVVTDKNGEVVTSVSSESESEGGVVVIDDDDDNNKKLPAEKTDKKDDKKDNKNKDKKDSTSKKEAITKPAAPDKITGLKVSNVTKDGLLLSWNGVKCDYYQLQYKKAGKEWKTVKDSMTSTKVSFEKALDTYTVYYFRVRAINENSAGKSATKWAEIKATTKADEKVERFIRVKALLPVDSNVEDTLLIYVNGKLDKEVKIHCNGKTKSVDTTKKYKGLVEVKAVLKSHKTSNKAKTDKDSITLDLTSIGIDQDVDDDPF